MVFPTLQQSPDGGAALVEFVVWEAVWSRGNVLGQATAHFENQESFCAPCGHFSVGLGIRLSDSSNLSAEASSPVFTRKLPPFKC